MYSNAQNVKNQKYLNNQLNYKTAQEDEKMKVTSAALSRNVRTVSRKERLAAQLTFNEGQDMQVLLQTR